MEKIPTPNIDPPPNLIIFKYVNSCNCKLHADSLPVLPFTSVTVHRAVETNFNLSNTVHVQEQMVYISKQSFVKEKMLPNTLAYKITIPAE